MLIVEERAMMPWKLLLLTALASTTLAAGTSNAQFCDPSTEVQNWYIRYLGRPADIAGLSQVSTQLQLGVPKAQVLGGMLGSDEYYLRRGATPEGFVSGLYADVLGRPATLS